MTYDDNIKIALIAVNANCHEQEEVLKNFVSNQLAEFGIETLKFKTHYIPEMVKEAKEADKTFIVFDAKEGSNPTFSTAALELYKQNIKPCLIVSNIDDENVNMDYAKNALAEEWVMENPKLETWDLDFNNLYFSYKKMGFDITPEMDDVGIKPLVDIIKNII